MKINSINDKIEKTNELKEFNFRQIDFYINQYKKMKDVYFELIKLQKSNFIMLKFYYRKKGYQFTKSVGILR